MVTEFNQTLRTTNSDQQTIILPVSDSCAVVGYVFAVNADRDKVALFEILASVQYQSGSPVIDTNSITEIVDNTGECDLIADIQSDKFVFRITGSGSVHIDWSISVRIIQADEVP